MCCKNHMNLRLWFCLFSTKTSLSISNCFDYIYNFLFQTFMELINSFLYLFIFKSDTKSPQFFNKLLKSVLHKKLNDWKMTRNSASSYFYMICLLSVDSVNAHLTCIVLGKSQYCWWLGPTLTWRHKGLGQSFFPLKLHPPHLLRKDEKQSVFCKVGA
jgi:hypothetical protein